jgi:hypothetical protein
MEQKSEVFGYFKLYKAQVENWFSGKGYRIATLRSDNGGEYLSTEMATFLKDAGIQHELTVPYTPQQNGVSERMNRTLVEAARTMLSAAKLPKSLWAEAINTAVYIRNRSITRTKSITPHEAWTGYKPSISYMKPFGCAAYVLLPNARRPDKWHAKSIKGIMVGYSSHSKAYRIMNLHTQRIEIARNVKFSESEYPGIRQISNPEDSVDEILEEEDTAKDVEYGNTTIANERTEANNTEYTTAPYRQEDENPSEQMSIDPDSDQNTDEEEPLGQLSDEAVIQYSLRNRQVYRNNRTIEKDGMDGVVAARESGVVRVDNGRRELGNLEDMRSEHHDEEEVNNTIVLYEDTRGSRTQGDLERERAEGSENQIELPRQQPLAIIVPRTGKRRAIEQAYALSEYVMSDQKVTAPVNLREMAHRKDKDEWIEACDSEYNSLMKNKTWELTELPPDRQPITCKWIFKIKHKADGSIERYKARLVVRGFSQKEGVDFNETFAPVIRFESVRVLLAIATEFNLEIDQCDVKTAFLNGDLTEEIYMEQPEGYEVKGKEHLVCRLKKSLYGLKQAPRCWNNSIHEFLVSIGFKQTVTEYGIYVNDSDNERQYIGLYVDDILILGKDRTKIQDLKRQLFNRFDMSDMGALEYFLGIKVTRDRKLCTLQIDQSGYIYKMLDMFRMKDAKEKNTPLDTYAQLQRQSDDKAGNEHEFRQIIGCLMYAMVATRPDIAAAVGILSQFCNGPAEKHIMAAKGILRYLKKTADYSLQYRRTGSIQLQGFCDADWAGDRETRRSTSGYVFLLAGGAVSWRSMKQHSVALSTTEAEYIALSEAVKETIWLRMLLGQIGHTQTEPTTIYEDNQGCISLAKDPTQHSRAKHIDIRYHFLREKIGKNEITLQYLSTESMLADILTKALPTERYQSLVRHLGLGRH